MNDAKTPRLLSLPDAAAAGAVLAQAFVNDPMHTGLFPNEEQRARQVPKLYAMLARASVRGQFAWGIGDPLAAVAIWTTPTSGDLGVWQFLRAGALGLIVPLMAAFPRMLPLFREAARIHEQALPEPHVYLQVLATRPESQGQGFGAALLRRVLATADAEGLPAWLETMTPGNVPLYEHFGFAVAGSRTFPNTGLTLWGMRRPASPQSPGVALASANG
jgi:ribosomal protein S18 acetylase RimI-like enzyme